MPQFAVHKNTNSVTKAAVPFLLDVQSDLIAELGTRVVVPLYTATAMKGKVLRTLTPTFEIEGEQYVMVTLQLAGIAKRQLGAHVADLSAQRNEIIAALDMLITGI
ncbi:CcdB family protein [Pseudomonas sp. CrR25]|nr:CcdB family protein [Pseudomonas sp. CrR25]